MLATLQRQGLIVCGAVIVAACGRTTPPQTLSPSEAGRGQPPYSAWTQDQRYKPWIVGGRVVPASEGTQFAFEVALIRTQFRTQPTKGFVCAGVLVANRWVLTAAHCVTDFVKSKADLSVLGGTIELVNGLGSWSSVIDIHPHPVYNGLTDADDLALIELEGSVSDTNIAIADVVSEKLWLSSGVAPFVSGWGHTGPGLLGQPVETTLRDVTLPLVSQADCAASVSAAIPGKQILPSMICAGSQTQSICHGDSGSPLLATIASRWTLVGVASQGALCGPIPAIFSRTSVAKPWITLCVQSGGKDCGRVPSDR